MSWLNLNQSLNSLKGQITNFASEVLSEGVVQDSGDSSSQEDAPKKDLEEKCRNQELEIAALKSLNAELEASLQSERLSRKNGVRDEDSNWYWDPPTQSTIDQSEYQRQIEDLQKEISSIKQKQHEKSPDVEEINRLREENKNLATSLEELDGQHQLAMERLLTLKKELQKNFEALKQEHKDLKNSNDKYAAEKEALLAKISERDKEIEELKKHKADYDTLHHKYMNLEKVHSTLKECAEKFQEDNQELHEEIFKLQENVTKYEHEIEIATLNAEMSNMVPRENYEILMKELNDLKNQKVEHKLHCDETNIDDNAKGVIEGLKREIRDLQHKVPLSETDSDNSEHKFIKTEKIMQMYNKYVNFELPVDYIGEMPSSNDNIVLFKLESSFKTLNSFKKDIDSLEHQLAEKKHDINDMEVQIFDLTNENEFLSNDLIQYQSELKEMKKNNDFLINEIAAIKNSSKLEPIIETHEENVVKLESELDKCNKINKTFESEIQRIENELTEVRKEKEILQISLKDIRDKYTVMLDEFEVFKSQSTAVFEHENGTSSAAKNQIKQFVDKIDELKKNLSASNATNEKLSIDISILENDKVLLTKEVDDLKHDLAGTVFVHKELEHSKSIWDKKFKDVEIEMNEVIKNKKELEDHKRKLQETVSTLEGQVVANSSTALELEILKTEKESLMQKLDSLSKENVTLRDSNEELTTKIANLTQITEKSESQNKSISSEPQTQCEDTTLLKSTIEELTAKIIQQETLSQQITMLKQEKEELIHAKLKVEAELSSTDQKIYKLEEDFERINIDLEEKDTIIDRLNTTVAENKATIENLNITIQDLNTTLNIKNEEIQRLNESSNSFKMIENELSQLVTEKAELSTEIQTLNEVIEEKNVALSTLEKMHSEFKSTLEDKDKTIKELNQSIVELTDKTKIVENCTLLNDEYAGLINEKERIEVEASQLKSELLAKDIELSNTKSVIVQLQNTIEEHTNAAAKEKSELINLINLKHNESIQYHNEIQRLNHVLLEQAKEFKWVVDEKDNIINNQTSCPNCENLNITLKEKDEIILKLNENTTEYEKMKSEVTRLSEVVNEMTEKCRNLDKSLAIQLETVKRLTAENAQLSEKEQNSTKELERLRDHLMETEENYTQELMASEQKLQECQARLQQVEERAKQTSTVYTSNSIRANQEVETLRNQIRLLEKQREDAQARLSEAEDTKSRREAALTNLQVVLEQFQLDKERDIQAATEKIRNKMADIKRQNQTLQDEIKRLNAKLEEALAGLQAASRLGDQVESKTAQISDLKEQVRTLQISVAAAEERYHNATSNQQDKVDKNLVKNLLMNYVVTAQNHTNKTQVLRILSTVLDFNQLECERLGLARSPAPDSLAAEFVKFLQNESTPRPTPAMPTPSASRSSTPLTRSRNNSTMGPSPTIEMGHQRNLSSGSNNLLFQNIDNIDTSSQISIESDSTKRTLETGVTQTRDTEGAILKHVLRDM